MPDPFGAKRVGLPIRPFLYTTDQIAGVLEVDEKVIRAHYLYYWGRSTGPIVKERMLARNIAPEDSKPEWRVTEKEFVRWLRFKGFKYYETSWVK